ncbi:MAG: DUF1284 domain-containing protein [Deltaproteobacteria bacterium]|nr:DUF1284 domain-containing protein [Deltaproteobacteria bacterium]
MIKLRPHHLFCVQGFNGYGYDDAFKRNMREIHDRVVEGNESFVVVERGDDICAKCPHLKDNTCANDRTTDGEVMEHDAKLMRILDFEFGREMTLKDLMDYLEKNGGRFMKIRRICNACSWREYCSFLEKTF